MSSKSDRAGNTFTSTLHSIPYQSIDPSLVTLPQPFVVCIAGASRDIGAHVAYSFAQAGVSGIAVCSPTIAEVQSSEIEARVREIDPAIQTLNVVCDLTIESSVDSFAASVEARFGRLDVLVYNAGFWGAWETRVESTASDFSRAFDVNCKGMYLASTKLLPLLLASENGAQSIIAICSSDMHADGTTGHSTAYCISQMAQCRYVEFLAAQHPTLFTAAIQPGSVQTEMAKVAPKQMYDSKSPAIEFHIMPTMPDWTQAARLSQCRLLVRHAALLEDVRLGGSFVVWLTKERRMWLSGRYLSAKWDVDELCSRQDEIVQGGKLKMRMVL